jgi:5-methylcytosine-specific restriction protein A
MVTSRTGTAKYMRNRRKVLDQARRDGIVNCPGYVDAAGVQHPCGRELNYDVPRLPESVEADHILAPKFGGTDDVENLTPLCRTCNIAKGDGSKTPVPMPSANDFPVSRDWFAVMTPGG